MFSSHRPVVKSMINLLTDLVHEFVFRVLTTLAATAPSRTGPSLMAWTVALTQLIAHTFPAQSALIRGRALRWGFTRAWRCLPHSSRSICSEAFAECLHALLSSVPAPPDHDSFIDQHLLSKSASRSSNSPSSQMSTSASAASAAVAATAAAATASSRGLLDDDDVARDSWFPTLPWSRWVNQVTLTRTQLTLLADQLRVLPHQTILNDEGEVQDQFVADDGFLPLRSADGTAQILAVGLTRVVQVWLCLHDFVLKFMPQPLGLARQGVLLSLIAGPPVFLHLFCIASHPLV
jgi:hypothetical protein